MDSKSTEIYTALKNIKDSKENLDMNWQKFMQEISALCCDLSVIALAAEKEIPYQPAELYTVDSRTVYQCKCGKKLTDKTAKYCKECGQRLAWQEEIKKNWPSYLDLPKE